MIVAHITHTLFIVLLFFTIPSVLYGLYAHRDYKTKKDLDCPIQHIPPILWTYHAHPATPEQRHALDTWRAHHPTWSIRILTPDTVHGYLRDLPHWDNAGPLRTTERWEDVVALHAIEEHGGVWLESTTALHGPLHFNKEVAVLPLQPLPHPTTLVSRHAFAGQRRSPFFTHWKKEYLRVLGYPSITHYLRSIFTITPLNTLQNPEEHVAALALEHALLNHPFPPESIDHTAFRSLVTAAATVLPAAAPAPSAASLAT